MLGKVKVFFLDRGFGFIASDTGDFFFHVSKVQFPETEIEPGLAVSFEVKEGERGPIAVEVCKSW